eukprot:8322176-Karenia_brevis.AAC.1
MGATRGAKSRGDTIKSAVRLLACPGDADRVRGWDTEYVRDTGIIRTRRDDTKYLGGMLGTRDQIKAHYETITTKTA